MLEIYNFIFVTTISLLIVFNKFRIYSLFLFLLSFIYTLGFNIGNVYIPFWIIVAFLSGLYFFIMLFFNNFKININYIKKDFTLNLLILLMVLSLFSMIHTINMMMSLRFFIKILFLFFLYFFLKKIFFIISFHKINRIIFIIYSLLVISALIQFVFMKQYLTFVKKGYFDFLISSNKSNYLLEIGNGFLIGHFNNIRVSLNFLAPHVFGIIFLFFSILVIYNSKDFLMKFFLILISLLVFLIIDSFTATFSFILIIFYLIFKNLFIIIFLFLIFIYNFNFFLSHLHTLNDRIILWNYAFNLPVHSVFGYGINTSKILLEDFNAFSFKLDKFHNIFIDLYLMVGPLGVSLFIIFLIFFYYFSKFEIRLLILIIIFINLFDDFFFDDAYMSLYICIMIYSLYFLSKTKKERYLYER